MKTRVGRNVKVINQNKGAKASSFYHSVLIKFEDGSIRACLFTETEIESGLTRAEKNIEDTLEQSFLSKLLD
jgi:hypothetical protein